MRCAGWVCEAGCAKWVGGGSLSGGGGGVWHTLNSVPSAPWSDEFAKSSRLSIAFESRTSERACTEGRREGGGRR